MSETPLKKQPDTSFLDERPSPALDRLFEHEKTFTRIHVNEFGPAVHASETAISALATACDSYRQIDFRPLGWSHTLVAYFLSASVPELFSAFRLGTKGFPDQANSLLRTSIEMLLRGFFVALHPADWEGSFMIARDYRAIGSDPRGKRQFNASNLLRDELRTPNLAKWFYAVPSKYVHGNLMAGILKVGAMADGSAFCLQPFPTPPPKYTWEEWMGTYINLLQATLYWHLATQEEFFGPHLPADVAVQVRRVRAGMRDWCACGVSVHSELVEDIDKSVVNALAGVGAPP